MKCTICDARKNEPILPFPYVLIDLRRRAVAQDIPCGVGNHVHPSCLIRLRERVQKKEKSRACI